MNEAIEGFASRIGAAIVRPGMKRKGVTLDQFKRAAEARRQATGFCRANQDEALVRGVKRYSRRFLAGGDPALATRLDGFAATAEAAMLAMQTAKAEAEAPRAPHVAMAAAAVAKNLMRTLPNAFEDTDEAQAWAVRYLPLAAARRAEDAEMAARTKAGKIASKHRREFLAAIEQASVLIFADSLVLEKNLRLLAEVGRDA